MPRPGEYDPTFGGCSSALRGRPARIPPRAGRSAYTDRVPFDVGPWELVVLLGVLVLLVGAKGVPDVAKRLGTGMRELKGAMGEVDPRRMLEPGDDSASRTPAARNDADD